MAFWKKSEKSETKSIQIVRPLSLLGDNLGLATPNNVPIYDNSVVFAAIRWSTRAFAEAPIRLKRLVQGQYEQVAVDPLLDLLRKPNPNYEFSHLMSSVVANLVANGNAYVWKIRDESGYVRELWSLPYIQVNPKIALGKIEAYEYRAKDKILIPIEDMIHVRDGVDFENPFLGCSPIRSVMREILTDNEVAQYTHAVLKNMGVVGTVITPEAGVQLDDVEAQTIARAFVSRFSGEKRGQPLVLSQPLKVESLGSSPADLDVSVLRQVPEARICAALGISPVVLGLSVGLENSTYSNMAEAREAAYEGMIVPLQRIVASTLTSGLAGELGQPNDVLEFDISEIRVLQEDETAKVSRISQLYQSGLITRAEARSEFGYEAGEEDKVFFTDLSLASSNDAAKATKLEEFRQESRQRMAAYREMMNDPEGVSDPQ